MSTGSSGGFEVLEALVPIRVTEFQEAEAELRRSLDAIEATAAANPVEVELKFKNPFDVGEGGLPFDFEQPVIDVDVEFDPGPLRDAFEQIADATDSAEESGKSLGETLAELETKYRDVGVAAFDLFSGTDDSFEEANDKIDEFVEQLEKLPGNGGRLGQAIQIVVDIERGTAELSGLNDAVEDLQSGEEAAIESRAALLQREIALLDIDEIKKRLEQAEANLGGTEVTRDRAAERLDNAAFFGVTDEETGAFAIESRSSLNATLVEAEQNYARVREEIESYKEAIAGLDEVEAEAAAKRQEEADKRAALFAEESRDLEIREARANGNVELAEALEAAERRRADVARGLTDQQAAQLELRRQAIADAEELADKEKEAAREKEKADRESQRQQERAAREEKTAANRRQREAKREADSNLRDAEREFEQLERLQEQSRERLAGLREDLQNSDVSTGAFNSTNGFDRSNGIISGEADFRLEERVGIQKEIRELLREINGNQKELADLSELIPTLKGLAEALDSLGIS